MDKQKQNLDDSNLNTDDFLSVESDEKTSEKITKSWFWWVMSKFWWFKKKDSPSNEDILDKDNKSNVTGEPSDNIFAQLSGDLDFWDDSSGSDDWNIDKKNIYDYLKISTSYVFLLNLLLGLVLLTSVWYIYIQKNESFWNKSFLDPVCWFILWDWIENTQTWCSSIAFLLKDYENKINSLKSDISSRIAWIIWDVYTIENFIYSREISFLLNSSTSRLRPLDLLNQFDRLKNDFSPNDKRVIRCDNIEINNNNIATFNCSAYSSSWERSSWGFVLVWESWNRLWWDILEWTSNSIAASFLNFIERNPQYNLRVVEKQKMFESESVVWEGTFVRKTDFSFTLRYDTFWNNLSL